MTQRIPNTTSPTELRQAWQRAEARSSIIRDGAAGEILIGVAVGTNPAWSTDLITLTSLTVDNISIDGAVITSDTGAISFSNENLTTTGTVAGVNVTSGENPGHTHTGASLSGIDISADTNLAVTSPIVLTDDTLSLNQGSVDHGSLGGLAGDDHTQYHNNTRGDARYYTETELNAGQLDTQYFQESEFLNTSAGAGDAGKPIKLDATGKIDSTMVGITTDEKAGVDADATAGYLGAAANDGVLRASTGLSYADGGDFVTLTTNDGEIAHDSLSGYDANKHVDHTGVTLTAGSGIAGGGTIAANRSFDLDINSLGAAAIAAGDFVPFWDITATATNKKITFANFEGTLNHDSLSGYVAAEHIDWTGASDDFGTSGYMQTGAFIIKEVSNDTNRLGIQSQNTATYSLVDIYAKDGDGTDNVGLAIFAKGTPTDWSPWEVMNLRWDEGNSEFTINTAGSEAGEPLNIYTKGNRGQLVLNADDTVNIRSFQFSDSGGATNRLGIQCRNSGAASLFDFYSRDGNGTDDVGLNLFAKGKPDDWVPYEILVLNWDTSEGEFSLHVSMGSGGTTRPLNIYTPGNSGQVYLKTDGTVGISNATPGFTLDVGGTFNVSGNCTFGGTGHDDFTDFVSDEHVAHSGVTLTAGSGLAGGGDISANRTFDLDINSLAAAVIAAGDFVPFWDITATATNKKITFTNFEAALTHDNLIAGTIADHDTTATGANLTSLTDDSMVDALHRHSELSASDGTPDGMLQIDSDGWVGIGIAPSYEFHVYTASANMRATFESGGNDVNAIFWFKTGTSSFNFGVGQNNVFRIRDVTNDANRFIIGENGFVCIGIDDTPDALLEIETAADVGQQAVTIDQNDADQAFIDFQGTSTANADNSISSWTTGASIEGFIWVEINGVKKRMAYYDEPTS